MDVISLVSPGPAAEREARLNALIEAALAGKVEGPGCSVFRASPETLDYLFREDIAHFTLSPQEFEEYHDAPLGTALAVRALVEVLGLWGPGSVDLVRIERGPARDLRLDLFSYVTDDGPARWLAYPTMRKSGISARVEICWSDTWVTKQMRTEAEAATRFAVGVVAASGYLELERIGVLNLIDAAMKSRKQ